jgi:hypothetical protein
MKKITKPLIVVCALSFVLFLSVYLNAINVRVARIVSFEGTTQVQRARTDAWIPAENDMRLYEGDTVKTGSKSKAVIQLDDGSVTQITSLSILTMDKLSKSLKGKNTNMDVDLGKAWMKVKKIETSKDKFSVGTPTAVAGVRGTYFSTEVEESTDSSFDVYEGEISVQQKQDPSNQVDVRSNYRTEVKRGQQPTAPSMIPKDQLQKGLTEGISGLSPENGSYDLKIDVNPPVIQAGGKAVVTIQFLENGKPYNGTVNFTVNLGGSASFLSNGSQTLEVISSEKGATKVEITDTIKEEVTINADVSFETKE